jgi:hypothetical protein
MLSAVEKIGAAVRTGIASEGIANHMNDTHVGIPESIPAVSLSSTGLSGFSKRCSGTQGARD